jgi:tropomyosin
MISKSLSDCVPGIKERVVFEQNLHANFPYPRRLRQTDVKAGHFERKVQALEQDRDQWEAKFEEMAKKYAQVQKELEDFQQEIGNI